jgi:hypothetical protein
LKNNSYKGKFMHVLGLTKNTQTSVQDHSTAFASPSQIVQNIQRVALPVIGLAILANLPVVSADFDTCVHDCAVAQKMNPIICAIICAIFGR